MSPLHNGIPGIFTRIPFFSSPPFDDTGFRSATRAFVRQLDLHSTTRADGSLIFHFSRPSGAIHHPPHYHPCRFILINRIMASPRISTIRIPSGSDSVRSVPINRPHHLTPRPTDPAFQAHLGNSARESQSAMLFFLPHTFPGWTRLPRPGPIPRFRPTVVVGKRRTRFGSAPDFPYLCHHERKNQDTGTPR